MIEKSAKNIKWSIPKSVNINGGAHLGAVAYMPDEEVFLIGGWNDQILYIFDAHEDTYFEKIMEIQVQTAANISNLKYIDELKFLIVGDMTSSLTVYR